MIEQYLRPSYIAEGEDAEDEAPDALQCPDCGRSDATTKASAIARANRGRFEMEDGSSAVYETELGSLLSQPPRPRTLPASALIAAFATGWILLVVDLLIVGLLRAQDQVSIPEEALSTATWLGIGWFGVLIPGAAVARYLYYQQTARRNMPRWRVQSRRWSTFYYCSRSDLVFIRGQNFGVAPEHIAALYAHNGYSHPSTERAASPAPAASPVSHNGHSDESTNGSSNE